MHGFWSMMAISGVCGDIVVGFTAVFGWACLLMPNGGDGEHEHARDEDGLNLRRRQATGTINALTQTCYSFQLK